VAAPRAADLHGVSPEDDWLRANRIAVEGGFGMDAAAAQRMVDALRARVDRLRLGLYLPRDRDRLVGQSAWGDHISELQRIRAELTRAETNCVAGCVDVIWPTVLAHGVMHGAARHAQRRADEAGPGRGPAAEAARAALAAAQRGERDFDAVDKDGRDAVWL
jgi:hypothetical protein